MNTTSQETSIEVKQNEISNEDLVQALLSLPDVVIARFGKNLLMEACRRLMTMSALEKKLSNMIPIPKIEVRSLFGYDVDSGFPHEDQADWMVFVSGKELSSSEVWSLGQSVEVAQELMASLGLDTKDGVDVIGEVTGDVEEVTNEAE